jgi:hypothetical protein
MRNLADRRGFSVHESSSDATALRYVLELRAEGAAASP